MENQTEKQLEKSKLIFTEGGWPFKRLQDAITAMKKKGLSNRKYTPIEVDNGFAIAPKAVETPKVVYDDPYDDPWGYTWVIFSISADKTEPEGWEGNSGNLTLKGKRGVQICLPNRFLHTMRDATIDRFVQRIDQPRRKLPPIPKYPFTRIKEGTKADYMKLKKVGNRLEKEHERIYGRDKTPEMVAESEIAMEKG